MRKLIPTALLSLLVALPAMADWKVLNGSATIETDGSSSLTLTCDNNANTGNVRSWLVRVDALDLRTLGPRTQVVFRFPGHRPFSLMGDNRMGYVSIEGMNLPNQSDLNTLVSRLKAASRVTVTLIDDGNGNAMEPLAFNLRGSSRAIRQVQQACQ